MKFLSFSFAILFSAFSFPLSLGGDTDAHASANLFYYAIQEKQEINEDTQGKRISEAVRILRSLDIVEPPKAQESGRVVEEKEFLCGLDVFEDLTSSQQKVIDSALTDIPCVFLLNFSKVVVYSDTKKPRAMAGATSLHLRSDFFALPEAKNVLIHELGHLVDLGGLEGTPTAALTTFKDGNTPVMSDDPSAAFYAISWKNNRAWKNGTNMADFVSEYGATDPFEDFSESFLFYIEHGKNFRALAAEYPQLQKKYDFFRDEVFGGEEFDTGTVQKNLAVRVWDATKI